MTKTLKNNRLRSKSLSSLQHTLQQVRHSFPIDIQLLNTVHEGSIQLFKPDMSVFKKLGLLSLLSNVCWRRKTFKDCGGQMERSQKNIFT